MISFYSIQHGETALDIAVRNKNSQALKKLLKYDCSDEILEEVKKKEPVDSIFIGGNPGDVPAEITPVIIVIES